MMPFVFAMMFENDELAADYKWVIYVITYLSGAGVSVTYLLPW